MPDPKVDVGGSGYRDFERDSYSFIFDFGRNIYVLPGRDYRPGQNRQVTLKVRRSTDGGVTWSDLTSTIPDRTTSSIHIADTNIQQMVVDSNQKVYWGLEYRLNRTSTWGGIFDSSGAWTVAPVGNSNDIAAGLWTNGHRITAATAANRYPSFGAGPFFDRITYRYAVVVGLWAVARSSIRAYLYRSQFSSNVEQWNLVNETVDLTIDNLGGAYVAMVVPSTRVLTLRYRNPANTQTRALAGVTLPAGASRVYLSYLSTPRHLVAYTVSGNSVYRRSYDVATNVWLETDWTVVDTFSSAPTIRAVLKLGTTRTHVLIAHGTNHWLSTLLSNHQPTQPDWMTASGSHNRSAALVLDWAFNDPDPADTQSKYSLRRTTGNTVEYWNGTSWASAAASVTVSDTSLTFPSGWGTDGTDYTFEVQTWDNHGNGPSPWSDALAITAAEPSTAALVLPAAGATISGATEVTWTVNDQTAYQVRVLTVANDPATAVYDSGRVGSSAARSHTVPFDTNGTYHIQLLTWNSHALQSAVQTHRVVVMLLPPATPLLIAAVHSEQNEVTIHVSQPAPTGNQPTVQRVEIWRKPDGAQGNGIIVAVISTEEWFTDRSLASGEDYEYRARAVGSNGTVAWSPWTDGDVTDDSTRPGAPSSLSLAASGGEVTAAWGAPSATGGLPSPIYRYEWSHDGVRWFTGTTTERTATIPGRYRHTFYFKVAAVNAVGRGSWASRNVSVGRESPGPPASFGLSGRVLSWTAPTDVGTSAVTGIILATGTDAFAGGVWSESSLGMNTVSHTISPAPTSTTFYRVAYVNSSGRGQWSRIRAYTP